MAPVGGQSGLPLILILEDQFVATKPASTNTSILDIPASLPALEMLKIMQLSREGDRREGILLRQSRGWFQVGGMGHEPVAALAYLLRPDDYICPYYRDRALALARGIS